MDSGVLSDFRSLCEVKGVARVPEQCIKDKAGGRHGDSAVTCAMMLDKRKELGRAEPWSEELFLSGIQHPLYPGELGEDAVEVFRFGDVAGWIIEGE